MSDNEPYPPPPLARLEYAVATVRQHITVLNAWAVFCAAGAGFRLLLWLPIDGVLLRASYYFRPAMLFLLVEFIAQGIGLVALRAPKRSQKISWLRASSGLVVAVLVLDAIYHGYSELSVRHLAVLPLATAILRRILMLVESVVFPLAIYLLTTHEVRSGTQGDRMIPLI